jgi:hypothetical protein
MNPALRRLVLLAIVSGLFFFSIFATAAAARYALLVLTVIAFIGVMAWILLTRPKI